MWPVLKNLMGGRRVQTLNAGTQSPQFELPAMDGSKFSLQDALIRGSVLVVFFKISCPTCQYALPYFERIYKTYGKEKLSIVGISQNDKKDTADFVRKYGVTFPVLLDDTKTFATSNAYGLTNVPTAFLISPDGEIEVSSVGWARKDFEEFARKAATITAQAPEPLFQPTEQIADFRAG
jgi:peroxiredoxin